MGENNKMGKNSEGKEINLESGYYDLDFTKATLITIGAGILLTLTTIWQLVIIAGFLGGFLPKNLKGKRGFLIGFIGVLSAWIIIFFINAISTEMLTFFQRFIVELAGLPIGISILLFLGCSLVGGLVGGLGGLNGVFVGRILKQRQESSKR